MVWLGPLCAFMSSVTWAVGSTYYSQLSYRYSAYSINFSRAFIAFPLLVILGSVSLSDGNLSISFNQFSEVSLESFGWLSLSMFSSYALGDFLFFVSTRAIGVPTALSIASSFPLINALWIVFVEGKKMCLTQWVGLLFSIMGLIFLILKGRKNTNSNIKRDFTFGIGLTCAFFTAICWAVNSYAVAKGSLGQDIAISNSVRMLVAMILCSFFQYVLIHRNKKEQGGTTFFKNLILLPEFSHSTSRKKLWIIPLEAFGGSLVFVYGLAHSPLVLAALLSSLAPVLSLPIAWVLKTENFSLSKFLAVFGIVTGLYLLASPC